MSGMSCIMVGGIPRGVRRTQLLEHFTGAHHGGAGVEYILHPLGNDMSMAVIKFTQDNAASAVLQRDHHLTGSVLQVALLPRQVLAQCQADVDPFIVMGLPNIAACQDLLRTDFGIKVNYDPDKRTMSLCGSFLQIQFAQSALNSIYRQQEELRLAEAASEAIDLPLKGNGGEAFQHQQYIEEYTELQPFSPRSVGSDHFSETESPVRSLHVEDLRAMLPPTAPQNTPNLNKADIASPCDSIWSNKSLGDCSVQDILTEKLSQSMQSTNGILPTTLSVRTPADKEDASSVPPKESPFLWNENAVDDLFASTVGLTGTGPHRSKHIQDDLLATDELMDSGSTLGSVSTFGKSAQRVVVEFETQLFDYMRRVHGSTLKDLEQSYLVQLQYKKAKEVTLVRILPAEPEDPLIAPHQARVPLINLYKMLVSGVTIHDIPLKGLPTKMRPMVDQVIAKVKKDFRSNVFVDTRDKSKVTLTGENEHVKIVESYIQKTLDLKNAPIIVKPNMALTMPLANVPVAVNDKVTIPKAQTMSTATDDIILNSLETVALQAEHSVQEFVRSPRQSVSSPIEAFLNPKESSKIPRELSMDPRESIKSPRESIKSRRASGKSPRASGKSLRASAESQSVSRSPREYRSKKESITSPKESTGISKESIRSSTIAPQSQRQLITTPSKSMKSPMESIKSPRDSVTNRKQSFGTQEPSQDDSLNMCSLCQLVTSPRHHILNKSTKDLMASPGSSTHPVEVSDTLESNTNVSLVEKASVQGNECSFQDSLLNPDVAIGSPRIDTQLPGTSVSIGSSLQTSIIGVTPLSSYNLSIGETIDTTVSCMSTGRSQTLDLNISLASNLDNHLSRVTFVSTGEFLHASSQIPRISTEDLECFKFSTKEGVKVSVYTGKIVEAEVDVIVCPVPEDMQLVCGVALDVSRVAGLTLQKKCTDHIAKHGPLQISEVFTVPASRSLRCAHVMFAVGPMWCLYTDKLTCETVLKQTLIAAFTTANQDLKVSSLAIPPIGTGELGFPTDVCAWAMLAAIEELSSEMTNNGIKEIHIINNDRHTTLTIGETLQNVLVDKESIQGTPALSPISCTSEVESGPIPFIVRLTAACVAISERAGAIIRDILEKGKLGIVEKGINDLQTEADRSAERCIVASLKAQFPGIITVGEESGKSTDVEVPLDWIELGQSAEVLEACKDLSEELCQIELGDVVVWVDPLDGTSEYTQGLLEHVTTLIGVGVKGQAKTGVIHQPFYNYQAAAFVPRGRSMWGIVGVGAFGLQKKPVHEGNIIVTTRSHGSGAVGEAVAACEPTDVVRVGGCGHKVALILEGPPHAYVFASPGCKKWDTAAPEAILHAAGGRLTDIHGNQLRYEGDVQQRNAAGVLATPPGGDHQWYLQRIPASVKEALPVIVSTKKLDDPMHTVNTVSSVLPPKKDSPFIAQLTAACVKISEHAGSIIRDILQKGELGIVEKGINDLQTEADRSAERCIVASLKAQFPGIVTVGEESGKSTDVEVPLDWIELGQSAEVLEACKDLSEELCQIELGDVVVWVDPLDGTSEYTQGLLEHVTTLIGVGVKGQAKTGVIHQPFYNYQAAAFVPRGRSMWGIVGVGAFGLQKKPVHEGNIIVTTRSHGSGAVGEAVAACEPTDVVRVGGCGHKVALILEGPPHAYVFASPGCKKWDTAAPEAILHAAGGRLTDIHGNQLRYEEDVQRRNAAGVLATPPGADHDWYLQRIPASVKDALPVIVSTKKLDDPMHTLTPTNASLQQQEEDPTVVENSNTLVLATPASSMPHDNEQPFSHGQPKHGKMTFEVDRKVQLPGYSETGTILITYSFPAGIQQERNPSPGEPYDATTFTAFLPNTQDGRHVLQLLRKAFSLGMTFTVKSSLLGDENKGNITWTDIPHKTSTHGGITGNGYPDDDYVDDIGYLLHQRGVTADPTPPVDK